MLVSFTSIAPTLESTKSPFNQRLDHALKDMRQGRPVILIDDFDRENEADLVAAAETVSVTTMALLIREGSGIVCLCLPEEDLVRLELPPMVASNQSCFQTAFAVTIDAREGITTGVSAHDRVTTIRAAVKDGAGPEGLVRPGHVFPLRAASGGIVARQGHTEGSVELARMAGMKSAAVICEITNPDGTMAKGSSIDQFAKTHDLTVLTIAELLDYRCRETEISQSEAGEAMASR